MQRSRKDRAAVSCVEAVPFVPESVQATAEVRPEGCRGAPQRQLAQPCAVVFLAPGVSREKSLQRGPEVRSACSNSSRAQRPLFLRRGDRGPHAPRRRAGVAAVRSSEEHSQLRNLSYKFSDATQ